MTASDTNSFLGNTSIEQRSAEVLERLRSLREQDAPTHGGRVLSYVYDSGLAALDQLATDAAQLVQPVNGLDPTVFPSTAVMERELVGFVRGFLHGDGDVIGNVTSGGTESCVLAVKAARDLRGLPPGEGSIVLPTTAHAAFHKAAHLLGLELILVAVDPDSGRVRAADIGSALRIDTVLIVASAPSYPFAALDPIVEIAEIARTQSVPFHVDACIGGFALPWWGELPAWDFQVPGVTSISADVHKYGYSPKGASVLLYRGRDLHRKQYFGLTAWPGYPVVNPTLMGSKSVAALAGAWSITQVLGESGYADLVARAHRATASLVDTIGGIDGLRVVGTPVGPLFAVAADGGVPPDRQVDPHRWATAVGVRGFVLQGQPASTQPDGTALPRTTHLTITPVTDSVLTELTTALLLGADDVRGLPAAGPPPALAELAGAFERGDVSVDDVRALPSEAVAAALVSAGLDPKGAGDSPLDMAAVLAAVESLPREVTTRLLVEFLAGLVEP
ncbi:pyridoxal phosphate-dependent decarboxylase family protein [Rhodococcus globerulus]|uniref:pyridoxal phosphate-dependent decarboxylase family protein n=1 Tax=Rhodococcus globerulus TaxID=33008 RepID=UPI000A5C0D95|nr:aminotransferase class V-fold PLP-dependent enzyme [Rhodococcus globerulus]